MNSFVKKKVEVNLRGIEEARRKGLRPVTGIVTVYYPTQELLAQHEPDAVAQGPWLHAVNMKDVADVVQEESGLIQVHYLYDPTAHRTWCNEHPDLDPEDWISSAPPRRWADIVDAFGHRMPGGAFASNTVVNCPGCFNTTPLGHMFRVGTAPDSPGLALCQDCMTEVLAQDVAVRNPDPAPCEFLCDNPDALKHFLLAHVGELYPERMHQGLPNLPHMALL